MTVNSIDKDALEIAARALWESEPHHLLAAAGHATDWDNVCSSIKKGMLKKARVVVKAYEAARDGEQ